MVGPIAGVVVVLAYVVYLVFGFHCAVLGKSDINANFRSVDGAEIKTCVGKGLVGTIDTNAASSCTLFVFLFFAVFCFGEGTDACSRITSYNVCYTKLLRV